MTQNLQKPQKEKEASASQDPEHSIQTNPVQVSSKYLIFSEEDLNKVDQLRRKIVLKPLGFFLTTSLLVLAAKKFQLRRLLANPLKEESEMAKNDKYWKFATYNTIIMGTIMSSAVAFFGSEANKIALYHQYEREISRYTKWRSDCQLRAYLNRTSQLDMI